MNASAPIIDTSRKPVPFHRLVDVEFRKLLDTRAGFWLLAIMLLAVVLIESIILLVALLQDFPMSWGVLFTTMSTPLGLLLAVLGVMTVTSEWGQRTSLVTFSLEPKRLRVVGAKLIAGIVATLATVVLSIIISAAINGLYGALSDNPSEWDMTGRQILFFIVVQLFGFFLGFAFGMLVPNTAVAIVLFFLFRYLVPGLMLWASVVWSWFADVQPWIDLLGSLGILERGSPTSSEILQLATSTGVWIVLPLTIGTIFLARREIK